jgi:hypothetical protein
MSAFLVDTGGTLITSLQAYWKLDEASRSRYDSINPGSGPAGQFTEANSEYLSRADNASLSTGNIDFTVTAWVYLDSKGANRGIVCKGTAAGDQREWDLQYADTSDRFQFRVFFDGTATSTTVLANSLGSPATATWYFIVAWHDSVADTINIQVNGGSVDSTAHSTGVFDGTGDFRIGANLVPNVFHNGRISLVGFWKKVLSSTERTSFYNSGNGKDYRRLSGSEKTSLEAYWNLHEGSGTRYDFHGANDLTDNNTVTQASGVGDNIRFQVDTNDTLTTSLIAYWKLDEASSTRLDTFGSNHLTDNNTVTQAVGKKGSAAQFTNANDEYLSRADNAALSVGDIDFTFACWVYLDSKTTDRMIISKGEAGGATLEYVLRYKFSTDNFQFTGSSDGAGSGTPAAGVFSSSAGSPSIGTWYFVAAWHDSVANTMNIQVNNGTVDSVSFTAGFFNGANEFRIGNHLNNPSNAMDGRIDEVGFWKKVLTAQERTDLYNGGFTNDPDLTLTNKLVSYWKLGEVSGLRDDFYGANNLTDNNTVTQAVGKVGNAAQFTAANSEYLSRADNASLSTGDIDFTIAAWVYMDSDTGDAMNIITKFNATTDNREYALDYGGTANRLTFTVNSVGTSGNNTTVVANSFGTLSVGTWAFVVCWHDSVANTINIQVNNGTIDSAATSAGVFNGTSAFRIGSNGNSTPGQYWNGRIDEIGFWKKVLTSTERTNLYNSGNGSTFNKANGNTFAALCNTLGDNATVTFAAGKTDITQAAGQFTAANSEYLSVPDNADLSTGDIDFTLCAWVYIDTLGATDRGVIAKGFAGGGTYEYALRQQGQDRIAFAISTTGTSEANDVVTPVLSTATWYFIVAWYDATANTMNILTNNANLQSTSQTPGSTDRAGALWVGRKGSEQDYFNGRIDEVGFWKKVLTAQEHTDLYNGGNGNTIVADGNTPGVDEALVAADVSGEFLQLFPI